MAIYLKILYFTLVLCMELLCAFIIISMCSKNTAKAVAVILFVFVMGTMFAYLFYLAHL
nr:MAG TPA: hypothetical protein [Caudoviricetes sp.]